MLNINNFNKVEYYTPSEMMNKVFELFGNNSNNLVTNIEELSDYIITESSGKVHVSTRGVTKSFENLDEARSYLFDSFKSVVINNCNGTKIANRLAEHLNNRFTDLSFVCKYNLKSFEVTLYSKNKSYILVPSEGIESTKIPCSAWNLLSICNSISEFTGVSCNVLYRGLILD